MEILVSERGETEQKLQAVTQEKDKVSQKAQILEGNLEISQLREDELNEQIRQLQIEISLVHKKLKEVETDRDNNYSSIKNHHKGKMSELEEERNGLVKKYEELVILYEENDKQLKKLNDELERSQSLSNKLKEDFIAACEELKDERNKNHELERKLETQTSDFTDQVLSLEKLSREEKRQLIQQITNLRSEKLKNEQQLAKEIDRLKNEVSNLKNTSEIEKQNLESQLNGLGNELQKKLTAETAYENRIQKLGLKIKELEQQVENLTSISETFKQRLISELANAGRRLSERNNIIENLESKKRELDNQIVTLVDKIDSLQQINQEEKDDFNRQIEDLKNAKLTSESELQKKIDNLNNKINSLSIKSVEDKKYFNQSLLYLQKELIRTVEERDKKEISIQKLNEINGDLQSEIKSLKNVSRQEKKDLLQKSSELQFARKVSEKGFKEQISNLKQRIEKLTNSSYEEKNRLNSKINDLELKLNTATAVEENYKETIAELEEKLENVTNDLAVMVGSLQEAGKEKDSLLDEVKNLRQSNLTAEQLSQQKISSLQEQINSFSKISVSEKTVLEKLV